MTQRVMTARDWMVALIVASVVLIAGGTGAAITQGWAQAQQVEASSLNGPPMPADAVPPSETVAGQIGAMDRYAREDHTHPRITRSTTVLTDASGNWSVTWSSAMMATPTVFPLAVNAGAQPITCNVATRTTTGATGRCWTASSGSLLNLSIITAGLTVLPYGNSAAGVQVQVIAIPPSQ